ncbi:MAG: hypothetical protein KGH71_05495 [Candidatus Micrarchaeota archaeon]|nr:hypothetical protein [Candidatus Micrarchaeota archaeon]MDE1870402.1 hypothetical protein [Candidatus Micrarchaeota archaeon]
MRDLELASKFIKKASDIQPCHICKADLKILSEFVKKKVEGKSPSLKRLKKIDYVNEITNLAILSTSIVTPLVRMVGIKAPELYEKILSDNMAANRQVKVFLVRARKEFDAALIEGDQDYAKVAEIIDSFIYATSFKVGLDPQLFYAYDKIIRFGYKTHLLQIASKIITGMKG